MLFNWIRTKVRNAVLAGVNDAVEELDHSGDDAAGEAVSRLRLRLGYRPAEATPALGVPTVADADANANADAASTVNSNGRRTRR